MTTTFRDANASGQAHHGAFSKGGQSKSLSGSGLKLPHRATELFVSVDAIEPNRRYASVLKLLIVFVSAAAIARRLMP
jgi:hypothetical protein